MILTLFLILIFWFFAGILLGILKNAIYDLKSDLSKKHILVLKFIYWFLFIHTILLQIYFTIALIDILIFIHY